MRGAGLVLQTELVFLLPKCRIRKTKNAAYLVERTAFLNRLSWVSTSTM